MKRREWIDDLLDAWEKVERTVDWATSKPFGIDAILPYYYIPSMIRESKAAERIDGKKIDLRKASAGPTGIREMLCTDLLYGKYFRIEKEQYMEAIDFYHKILQAYSPEDPFTYNGTNKIYNRREVGALIKRLKWHEKSPEEVKQVGKLLVSLASLIYVLYNDMMPNLGREFHGPYDVSRKFGKGAIMIARDYFDIKPTHLWKHCRNYKYKTVNVLAVYKGLKITFDFYGNYTTLEDLNKKLVHYAVLVDGKQVTSLKKLKEISEYLAALTIKQVRRVDRMNFEQTKLQYLKTAESFFKEMYEIAGMDWRPTKEMINKVKGRKLIKGFGAWGLDRALTPREIIMFKKIMDPRTNVYYNKRVDAF